MARAITVKVATPKVINALETKLATIKSDYSNQEANEAKYQEAVKAWNNQIKDYAIANISNAENFRTNYRSYNNTLNIDFDVMVSSSDLPTQPEREFEQMAAWSYKEVCEEITNALSILRMTDEETVNASTMKSIARYL